MTPSLGFAGSQQGPNETFVMFIDHFTEVVDEQTDNPQAKEDLLWELAVSKANLQCRKILRALPVDPEPTITQMVEACTQAGSS